MVMMMRTTAMMNTMTTLMMAMVMPTLTLNNCKKKSSSYFGGKILWKWFLNKVQPLFFDVIPTKRRQGPQYGLLGLWGPGGIMFSSLANEASSPSQHILWLNHNFQEMYARFLYRLPKVD